MLVLWQDPSALPAHHQHLSAPAPSRARGHRIRTHVSNPLYLQVRGSDRTEKYPTYRRDGASTPRPSSLSSPLPPRRHHNHHHLSRVRGGRPPSRPLARRPLRNRHRHTLTRGEVVGARRVARGRLGSVLVSASSRTATAAGPGQSSASSPLPSPSLHCFFLRSREITSVKIP